MAQLINKIFADFIEKIQKEQSLDATLKNEEKFLLYLQEQSHTPDRYLRSGLQYTEDFEAFKSFQKQLVALLKMRDTYMNSVISANKNKDIAKGLVIVDTVYNKQQCTLMFHQEKMQTRIVKVNDVFFEINVLSQDDSNFAGVEQGEIFYSSKDGGKIYLADNLVHYQMDNDLNPQKVYEPQGINSKYIHKILATSNPEKFSRFSTLDLQKCLDKVLS